MLSVLVLGMLAGLIIAIALSILLLLTRMSRPSLKVIERPASEPPGLLALRPNAMLIFANARYVRTSVVDVVRERVDPAAAGRGLDLEMSYGMDVESADTLAELRTTLHSTGTELWLATVRAPAADVLRRSGYFDGGCASCLCNGRCSGGSVCVTFPSRGGNGARGWCSNAYRVS